MRETVKVVIEHKVSPRFARVVWKSGDKVYDANICDVLDGKTKATGPVKKFASTWMAPNL